MASQSKLLRALSLLVRLILAAVFAYAAWIKLKEPWALFAISVDAYHVLPHWAVIVVARGLPWFELVLALLLLSGLLPRITAVSTSTLLLVFFSLMVRAYTRGEAIDCGCFGPGEAISPLTMLRDGGLLAAALFLTFLAFRRPPSPVLAGTVLSRDREGAVASLPE